MSEEKYKGQTKRIWYQKGIKDEQDRIRREIESMMFNGSHKNDQIHDRALRDVLTFLKVE